MIQEIFSASESIRYVAIYMHGMLDMAQKEGIEGASQSESDKYEELLVNPTLLRLASQRGNIDCGGLNYLVIRYGNFYQLVIPFGDDAHISVCVDKNADPIEVERAVREKCDFF